MDPYTIVYTPTFKNGLTGFVAYWKEELLFSDVTVALFLRSIYRSISLLVQNPTNYQEISALLLTDTPTYWIEIGQSYTIVYRIDHVDKKILIGTMIQQKQLVNRYF